MPLTVTSLAEFLVQIKNWSGTEVLLQAGGSCSGKSALALELATARHCDVIHGDDWALPARDVLPRNLPFGFESPEAYDLAGLGEAITCLLSKGWCEKPVFDFTRDCVVRTEVLHRTGGLLVVEFLHAFHPAVREALKAKRARLVWLDADVRVRLMRRLKRDLSARGKLLREVTREWQVVLAAERKYFGEYRTEADLLFHDPTQLAREECSRLIEASEATPEERSELLAFFA